MYVQFLFMDGMYIIFSHIIWQRGEYSAIDNLFGLCLDDIIHGLQTGVLYPASDQSVPVHTSISPTHWCSLTGQQKLPYAPVMNVVVNHKPAIMYLVAIIAPLATDNVYTTWWKMIWKSINGSGQVWKHTLLGNWHFYDMTICRFDKDFSWILLNCWILKQFLIYSEKDIFHKIPSVEFYWIVEL